MHACETSTGYQSDYLNPLLNLQMKQMYHKENNGKWSFSKSNEVRKISNSLQTQNSI